jgi:hypothetical protein
MVLEHAVGTVIGIEVMGAETVRAEDFRRVTSLSSTTSGLGVSNTRLRSRLCGRLLTEVVAADVIEDGQAVCLAIGGHRFMVPSR